MDKNIEYTHLLITRFNVRIPFVKQKKLDEIDTCTDAAYLHERFDIFETYTLPSVVNQTCKDFFWIVLFDESTPDVFKRKIEEYKNQIYHFVPIYLKDGREERTKICEFLRNISAKYAATTRMDNDDAINCNFIEKIQKHIKRKGLGYYTFGFQNGIQYDTKRNMASYYRFPLNHFTTMVSPVSDNMKYIYSFYHTEIGDNSDFENIVMDEPMWLETVHGTNVSNRMHSHFRDIYKDPQALNAFYCHISWDDRCYKRNVVYSIFIVPINVIQLMRGYGVKMFVQKTINKIRHGHG